VTERDALQTPMDRNGRGPDDDQLTPELRRAVAVLRRLPPTSPGAAARVAGAAAAADVARRAGVRRWMAGALAATAAGAALFAARDRGATPPPSPPVTAAAGGLAAGPRDTRNGDVRAVGNGVIPGVGAEASDAPWPVTFVLRRPGARAVALVGDFNRWDAHAAPLALRRDGAWAATVPLAPGRHAYRFVVDDSLRVLDPRAPAERDAELGVARSIVVVGAP